MVRLSEVAVELNTTQLKGAQTQERKVKEADFQRNWECVQSWVHDTFIQVSGGKPEWGLLQHVFLYIL